MKHRKPLFILLIAVLALQIILMPVSAEYTGPNSGARRYSYEVEVPGTCTEEYSCCTWWSDTPCGTCLKICERRFFNSFCLKIDLSQQYYKSSNNPPNKKPVIILRQSLS